MAFVQLVEGWKFCLIELHRETWREQESEREREKERNWKLIRDERVAIVARDFVFTHFSPPSKPIEQLVGCLDGWLDCCQAGRQQVPIAVQVCSVARLNINSRLAGSNLIILSWAGEEDEEGEEEEVKMKMKTKERRKSTS